MLFLRLESALRRFHWIVFSLLLLASVYFRFPGIFVPSDRGDQPTYNALAMKMNDGWMKHYDVFHFKRIPDAAREKVDFVWEDDPRQMAVRGIRPMYQLPLHIQPPLLANLIWISHGIFKHGEPYSSLTKNYGRKILREPPWRLFQVQFYAVAVSWSASLMTLILVYLFCLKYFSYVEGLIATFLLAVSPVDIGIAPRILPDALGMGLGFLALLLFFRSLEKSGRSSWFLALCSGIFLGLAYLAKLNSLFLAIGFFFSTLVFPGTASLRRRLLDARLWLAALGAFLITLPWHFLVWKHYASPLPPVPVDLQNSSWHRFVFNRPPHAYFLGMLYLLPPLALGWIEGLRSLFRPRKFYLESTLFVTSAFYLSLLVYLLLARKSGLEHRYPLAIYPLLAILSGRAMVRMIRAWLAVRRQCLAWMASCVGLAYLGWRAVQIGWNALLVGTTVFKPLGW
ncbi:MAG TPA: hypothetical protein DF383_08540 [Deltaproteobacteria bacterium]|nr:hypothetical protein [Deltaproteobacteria bacterium]